MEQKTIWGKIEYKHILSTLILLFAFTLFIILMFCDVKQTAQQYASQIITALIAFISAIVGYFIGSSSGSQKKDAVISNMTGNAPTPTVTTPPTPTTAPSTINDQMPKTDNNV